MDDSDIERILNSIEHKYGKTRTEFAGKNKDYRRILLDQYIYGDLKKRQERKADGKRTSISAKQDLKLKTGFKAYAKYGRVDIYTLRAIRSLMKKGKA